MVLHQAPTPLEPTTTFLPASASDLLGFDVSEFVDDEPSLPDRQLLRDAESASANILSTPGTQDMLRRIHKLLHKNAQDLMADAQELRSLIYKIQAQLPPSVFTALLSAAHIDDKKAEVDAAISRISKLQSQREVQELLDAFVADAKEQKKQLDLTTKEYNKSNSIIVGLEAEEKRLEDELAKIKAQLQVARTDSAPLSSAIDQHRTEVTKAIRAVKNQMSLVDPVPSSNAADERIIASVESILASAVLAISGIIM